MNSNKNETGTMRDNRIDKKAPLLSKVSVNKKPRGYAQTISASVESVLEAKSGGGASLPG